MPATHSWQAFFVYVNYRHTLNANQQRSVLSPNADAILQTGVHYKQTYTQRQTSQSNSPCAQALWNTNTRTTKTAALK